MKKSYIISYDLVRPGQNYQNLMDAIKALGLWWHCLDSTWIVKSSLSAVQIRDLLVQHIDGNDRLLVAGLTREGAWRGFGADCSNWLTNNL